MSEIDELRRQVFSYESMVADRDERIKQLETQIADCLAAFPLFDDENLNEIDHVAERVLLQERKRLHGLLGGETK